MRADDPNQFTRARRPSGRCWVSSHRPVCATLEAASFRRVGSAKPVVPEAIVVKQALRGDWDSKLITIRAKLIGVERAGSDPTLILTTNNSILTTNNSVFSAVLPRQLAASAKWTEGSTLLVTGVCSVKVDAGLTAQGDGSIKPTNFQVLLRSASDVSVEDSPSWWTSAHTLLVLGMVMAASLAISAWGFTLRRRVRQQTEVIQKQLKHAAILREQAEAANLAKSEFWPT